MGRRCIYCLCFESKEPNLSFYTFPKDPEIKQKWTQILQLTTKSLRARSVVCGRHFKSDQKTRCHLIKNALPFVEKSIEQKKSKCRGENGTTTQLQVGGTGMMASAECSSPIIIIVHPQPHLTTENSNSLSESQFVSSIEAKTSGGENCLLCLKSLHNTRHRKWQDDRCFNGIPNEFSAEINSAGFLLRKLLEIPKDLCCELAQSYGNLDCSIACCDSCYLLVEEGRNVYSQAISLRKQFKRVQRNLKDAIFNSEEEVPSCDYVINGVSGAVRSYFKNEIKKERVESESNNHTEEHSDPLHCDEFIYSYSTSTENGPERMHVGPYEDSNSTEEEEPLQRKYFVDPLSTHVENNSDITLDLEGNIDVETESKNLTESEGGYDHANMDTELDEFITGDLEISHESNAYREEDKANSKVFTPSSELPIHKIPLTIQTGCEHLTINSFENEDKPEINRSSRNKKELSSPSTNQLHGNIHRDKKRTSTDPDTRKSKNKVPKHDRGES